MLDDAKISYYTLADYDARRSIGYLLRRSGKLITAQIEALFVEEDISFVQWVILMHLREKICTTAAELCQHLCHDSGALTRVLDQMEERNLITRQRSLEDRRMVTLDLTPDGRKVADLYLPKVIQLYNGLLTDFSKEEADLLVKLLTKLIVNLMVLPDAGV